MSKDTGGPAFPTLGSDLEIEGMTLRDYFASKAMQSLMHWDMVPRCDFPLLAGEAYEIADAMLAERSKQ